jgi:hypothetical protein
MTLYSLRQRLAALAARVPSTVRVPRLCVVMVGDPDGDRKCHEAAIAGNPVLRVELFNSNDQQEQTCLNSNFGSFGSNSIA